MIRALRWHLIASLILSATAGGAYGAGLIEVPTLYGVMAIAIIVSLAGYVRWDEGQHV